MSTTNTVNFVNAGYVCPADWARLRDEIPDVSNNADRAWLSNWRFNGQPKLALLTWLKTKGVNPGNRYDAEKARTRRVA